MLVLAVIGGLSLAFAQDSAASEMIPSGAAVSEEAGLETGTAAPEPERATRDSDDGPSGMSGKKGKKKNKKGKDGDSDKKYEKKKILGWTVQPYVKPGGGVQITENGTSVVAGADVGALHTKKKWAGDLYVGASYTTGDAYDGYELHLGEQIGTRQKYWGLTGGLEGFYDGYTSKGGNEALDPSLGLDVPVRLVLGPKKYFAYGTVTPAFLAAKSRHARKLPEPIDELEWGVGAGLNLKWITLKAGFTQRITASGVINTPTISGSFDGL